MRQGWKDPAPARFFDELQDRLDRVDDRGSPKTITFSDFVVSIDTRTWGAQIAVQLWSLQGLDSIVVLRNFSRDPGSTSVVHTWSCSGLRQVSQIFPLRLTYADADGALTNNTAYYWIKGVSTSSSGEDIVMGPQVFDASGQSERAPEVLDFDVSLAASTAGVSTVGISSVLDSNSGSTKIYISGYEGTSAFVAIAQSESLSFNFKLQTTGEVVVLRAIAVSKGGIESAGGPEKTITLAAAGTVPAKIMNVVAAELPSVGVQITWRAGAEPNVVAFVIYRGPKGGGFLAAVLIASLAPNSSVNQVFLDGGGLSGRFEWYVIARNGAGDSPASAAATCLWISTSANLPPNPAGNSTNDATVDSIDGGGSATVRIYGPGGPGSSWTRTSGFGEIVIPSGTILGQPYLTDLWIVYDSSSYHLLANYKAVMPDEYLWAGKITTVGPSSATSIAASPTGASRVSNVTTIQTNAPHGGFTGQSVVIAGVVPTGSVAIAGAGVPGTTRTASVVTVQTVTSHSMLIGQTIVASGVAPSTFNGTFVILSTPTGNTLTVAQSGIDESGGGGALGVTFNGSFVIASVPSSTTLCHSAIGPDDSGGGGTALISGGGVTGGGDGSGGATGHDGGHYLTY